MYPKKSPFWTTKPGITETARRVEGSAVEPPYQDKLAQQRAILATGASSSLDYGSLLNNGLTMIEEFELKGSGDLELNPAGTSFDASIQFGNNAVDLNGL